VEVQVRERCHWCDGTGKITNRLFGEVGAPCDCDGGYRYSWMNIGELAHEMERAKIVWEDERARNRSW
jgi:hypothetical protein